MKLEPDCIREILLAVEAQTGYQQHTYAYTIAESCTFPLDTVLYHIDQCDMYGFFTKVQHFDNGDDDSEIYDLTPKGHEFIQNIRTDTVWKNALQMAKGSGSFSVQILSKVAESIILKKLGL